MMEVTNTSETSVNFATLHGGTSQKPVFFTLPVVKT
jgi:hypothetical protein